MTEEMIKETQKEECKCFCKSEGFRNFVVVATGTFVGVFCAISLFAALHKPPKFIPVQPRMMQPPVVHQMYGHPMSEMSKYHRGMTPHHKFEGHHPHKNFDGPRAHKDFESKKPHPKFDGKKPTPEQIKKMKERRAVEKKDI